jgi:hypothetical protein
MLRCAGYILKRDVWIGYIGWTRVGRRLKWSSNDLYFSE